MTDTKAPDKEPTGPCTMSHTPVSKGVGDVAYTPPPVPFPNSSSPGPKGWVPVGRSRGPPPHRKPDPRTCRAAGSRVAPLSPQIIPSLPGSLSPSSRSLRSDLGLEGTRVSLQCPLP